MTDDLHHTLAEAYRAGRDAAGPHQDRIEAGLAAVFARLARGAEAKRVGRNPGTLYMQIEVTPHEWATRGQAWSTWSEASPAEAVKALRDEADRWEVEYGLTDLEEAQKGEFPTDLSAQGQRETPGKLLVAVCGDMEDHARSYNEGFADGSAGEERVRMAIEWLRQIPDAPLSRDTVLDIITDALDGPDVIAAEEALDGASSKACGNGEAGA